jgi:hypothetical protein
VSILKVHTKNMNAAGRLLVRDPPQGTTAARHVEVSGPIDDRCTTAGMYTVSQNYHSPRLHLRNGVRLGFYLTKKS